jgi:deoxycytidylate deaminase
MLRSSRGISKTKLEGEALEIISTYEDERGDPDGQRVIECYPHADYVLDCTSYDTLTSSAERLVRVYFGSPFISPSVDEYCSYIENAASYRSLDLSRQVGAAIAGENCEIISMGCNEVPKAGGGTYWSGTSSDYRDYALGYDSNQKLREDMTRDVLVRLQDKNWLSENFSKMRPDQLVEAAFSPQGTEAGPLAQSMLSDVIEYGRMVHAEMNALADAARFRRSTVNATLYCTTLPCHMCTKLIVASGIMRVVFIQPYGKSLIDELFSDSVAIDERPEKKMVIFESLKGVTPNGFKVAFQKNKKRKDSSGKALKWDALSSRPTFVSTFPYYQPLEDKALADMAASLGNLKKAQECRRAT